MLEKKERTLVLSSDDVVEIVSKFGIDKLMDELIERLQKAVFEYDSKRIDIPIRSGFNYKAAHTGLIEWMPVHKKGEEVIIKVVGYHPGNPNNFSLPTILSSISSYDTRTGHLLGIADGVLLTALRTGAASAVASRFLAHPESSVLGLIGCGAQSITQLHGLSRLFDIKKIMICDIDPMVVNSFYDRVSVLNLNTEIVTASAEEIIESSDILCTQTSIEVGEGPLFDHFQAKPYLHVNAVGSDFPGKIELPLSLLHESLVCPDFLQQAKIEGECQKLEADEIGPDWVKLIQNYDQYENDKYRLTVFDSTGWALEDQVVLDLFLDLAKEFRIGLEVPIENISEDAKNPYHFLLKAVPTV